jgi:hypothetical protein
MAALVLTACWSPIYNERVSAGAALSRKLDALAIESRTIGPIVWNNGGMDSSLEYLPSKFADLASGLLVERNNGYVRVHYFGKKDASSDIAVCDTSVGGSLGFAERTIVVSAVVDQSFAAQILLLGQGDAIVSANSDLSLYYRDPASSCDLIPDGIDFMPTLPASYSLVAAGSVLQTSAAGDDIELLYSDTASGGYQRIGFSYDTLTPPAIPPAMDGPYPVTGIGLSVNKGSRLYQSQADFYLCAYSGPKDGEAIHCFRWKNSGVDAKTTLAAASVELPAITAPIVGILASQGLILAQDELFLYAFDADGQKVFKVPSGDLRFAQEFNVDGYPCAVFTRVLATQSNNTSSYAVSIWAVRSDAVSSIGG